MSSVWELNEKRKEKFKTTNNTFDMFPVDTHVQVIALCQDFNFFKGTETGTIINNNGQYLGITVQFDEPRYFKDGSVQKEFNFAPEDLIELPVGNLPKEVSFSDRYSLLVNAHTKTEDCPVPTTPFAMRS